MITSVRFCLSYDLLNAILSPSKFVYFHVNFLCCNGRRHDVTRSRRKCCVTCVYNIRIYHEREDRIELNLSIRITVCHHLASLVMPNGDPRDGLFYPTLTRIMDSLYAPKEL